MDFPQFSAPPPKTGLIGHRGVAALAPENTLSSFKLAKIQNIDWIEFDVRLTKDNELIIFHDDTLERTTNGVGLVHEQLLSQIMTLDAGSWFNSDYKNEPVPQFSNALTELINLNLYLNIELKIPPESSLSHETALCTQLIQILNNQWPKNRPWPLVSSFHWPLLYPIRAAIPEIPLGFLSEECTRPLIQSIANIPNAAFHCNYLNLNVDFLKVARSLAVPVLTYTVNQPEIASQLLQAGVFGIFSDNPQYLIQSGVHQGM